MHSSSRLALVSLLLVLMSAMAAAAAMAAPSPPRSEPSQPVTPAATSTTTLGDESAAENRALAEQEYKKGYKDSQEAKKLQKSGKSSDATEKFAKALKHFEEAIRLHEPYAEAWNMIGFCSRKVGDLRRAFDAYDRSLAINLERA